MSLHQCKLLRSHLWHRCLQRLIVDFLKNRVGRLRPDFADRVSLCLLDEFQPKGSPTVSMEWNRVYWVRHQLPLLVVLLTNWYSHPSVVIDGHRSFPSGHSSAAWVGMTFLFLYFADKTNCFRRMSFDSRSWRSSALLRFSLTLSPLFLSTWVAITRLEDYVSLLFTWFGMCN